MTPEPRIVAGMDIGRIIQNAVERKLQGITNVNVYAMGRDDNPIIARTQAKTWNRDPWYMNKQARTKLKVAILKDAGQWTPRTLEYLRSTVLKEILGNVKRQVNKDGSIFRNLTDNYAAWKRRKFGFTRPILKATGDLLGGLTATVDRITR